jgi:hypothetical protein
MFHGCSAAACRIQPKLVPSCRSLRVHFPRDDEGIAEILQDRFIAVNETCAQKYLRSEALHLHQVGAARQGRA